MDKKGPGSLRDLGSFEGLHPPFIDLTLMSRRGAVHCLHTYRWPRLETGPRHQQNCADCHKENARPVRSEPQESHAAPWRLQSVSNRPRGIRAAKRSPPNSGARHVQDSAENHQVPRGTFSPLNSSLPRTQQNLKPVHLDSFRNDERWPPTDGAYKANAKNANVPIRTITPRTMITKKNLAISAKHRNG
jgi:hypothetical protein